MCQISNINICLGMVETRKSLGLNGYIKSSNPGISNPGICCVFLMCNFGEEDMLQSFLGFFYHTV